jgi:hypothetical protein
LGAAVGQQKGFTRACENQKNGSQQRPALLSWLVGHARFLCPASSDGDMSERSVPHVAERRLEVLDLPSELICRILCALDGLHDIAAALIAHRAFHSAAADPELWSGISSRWRWRLRLREGETARDFCKRSHAGTKEHFIQFVGGTKANGDVASEVFSRLMFAPRKRQWELMKIVYPVHAAAALGSDGTNVCAVGGFNGQELPTATVYHWAEGRTRHYPALPGPLCSGSADVDSRRQLWFTGGASSIYRGASVEKTIQVLPLGNVRGPWAADRWATVGALQLPRCGHVLAHDGRTSLLYSVGGYGGGRDVAVFDVENPHSGGYHDTVETFDVETGKATLLGQRMASARTGVGAGFGPCGCLYVVGGSSDGSNGSMLGSCERYDPRSGLWQPLPPMPTARGYLAATFGLDGVLYVAGGARQGTYFRCGTTVFEAFDPRKGEWESLPAMPEARANFQAALTMAC